jgi:hypothetical protein
VFCDDRLRWLDYMRKASNGTAYAAGVIFEKDNGNLYSITDVFKL